MRQIAMLLVVVLFCGWALVDQAREPEPPERYSLHMVQSGDTLWGISRQYIPEVDPRLGVEWISWANGLQGTIIRPGDVLNVPDFDGPLMEPLEPWYPSPEATKVTTGVSGLREKDRNRPKGTTSRTMTRGHRHRAKICNR